ncbi:MAG: thioredoxin family protein [Planctomycetota bacterium]
MSTRRKMSLRLAMASVAAVLAAQHTQADQISWRHSLDAAKVEAGRTGKLVLLHFYTPSCGPCKKLERDVFSQPQIAATIEQYYVPVKLNADQSPAIANAYQITRVPSEVVLNSQGNVLQKLHCPLEPNAYGAQIANVAQHYQSKAGVRPASAQAPINSAYAGLKIGQSANQAASPQQALAVQPQITANPYFKPTPPPVTRQPAQAGQPPVAASAPPTLTGNRYARVTTPTPNVAQPPIAQPSITQSPTTSTRPPVVTPKTPAAPAATSTAVAAVAAKPPTGQVTPPQPAKADPWPPELPVGTPQLAFDGYCPVSLKEQKKWVRGEKEYGAIHRGRTYLFASDALRQKFLASTYSSDAYSPVFSGDDPVKLLDDNEQVAGSRKYGFEYRNAFYLFSSKETMERFARQPDRYSAGVRQAMARMEAAAGATVRR